MMDGITILHQYETGHPDVGLQIFCGLIIICIIGLLIWDVIGRIRHTHRVHFSAVDITFLSIVATAMLGLILYIGSWQPHTEYKVTIDESVPYIEFMENYKVINQEGDIYTIREIEGE